MARTRSRMARPTNNLERLALEHRLAVARREAEAIVERLCIRTPPVDPVAVAATERRLLRLCPGDYASAFDGLLEYHPSHQRFLCFYNTRYDRAGHGHAPRTRFSLAHELGHFFIETHHEYLRSGGKSHRSRSEFATSTPVEQQADCFAAHLLMPDRMVKPIVNREDLSIDLINEVATTFQCSFVSAALRTVECSHFYGAVGAICAGQIAWMFCSKALIENGIYPGERGPVRSDGARRAWLAFETGADSIPEQSGWARQWFRIYDDDRRATLPLIEAYLPARIMETLIVVLNIPEDELYDSDE